MNRRDFRETFANQIRVPVAVEAMPRVDELPWSVHTVDDPGAVKPTSGAVVYVGAESVPETVSPVPLVPVTVAVLVNSESGLQVVPPLACKSSSSPPAVARAFPPHIPAHLIDIVSLSLSYYLTTALLSPSKFKH
jgi:hypothetical protein